MNTRSPYSRSRLRESPRASGSPRLTFSPLAWLKLQWFLHAGPTEVGGFGISHEKDPLYIEDFATVRQRTTAVTVAFDDTAVADYFDRCVDAGLTPSRFARVWVHTHPGDSTEPSSVDEETFARAFGSCDWAVMFILSRTDRTYARLRFSAGPGGQLLIPVVVDWAAWPRLAHQAYCSQAWKEEFERNVIPSPTMHRGQHPRLWDRESVWSADLMLGSTWPWDQTGQSIEDLHEQAAAEAELVEGFDAVGTLDGSEEMEVIYP